MNTIELIKKELEVLVPVLVNELNIPASTYTYDEDGNNLASCHATIYKHFMTVVDISFDKHINFSPIAIEKHVKCNYPPFMRDIALRSVIRHAIVHEHRHAWQYEHNKPLAMKHHTTAAFGLNGLLGYGTSDVEEDANVYATSKAIDEDEKLIFEYERLLQRSSQFQDVQEKQQMFSCYRKILKKYTLPKAIKGAAIAATGIGIATLIYKALNNKRR